MTKIFISGSREIPYLPEEARTRIDRMLASGFDIVVGDSERGVDANVIRYLDQAGYDNVSVYTVHERPRTAFSNPHWVLQKITSSIETKTDKAGRISNGRELETEKIRRWAKLPTLV